MRVKFNQAVHLKGKTVKGKDYPRGTHEVHEEHLQDPHFHKLLKAGLVEDGEAAQVVAPLSLQERQKQLAERLAKPKAHKSSALIPSQEQSAAMPAAEGSGDATPPSPPADESMSGEHAPPEKSEEEQLAEMEAEEAAKAEKSKAEKAKSKHKGK